MAIIVGHIRIAWIEAALITLIDLSNVRSILKKFFIYFQVQNLFMCVNSNGPLYQTFGKLLLIAESAYY